MYRVLRAVGFHRATERADWELLWAHDYPFKPELFTNLQPHQKVGRGDVFKMALVSAGRGTFESRVCDLFADWLAARHGGHAAQGVGRHVGTSVPFR